MKIINDRLDVAKQRISPNFSERHAGTIVDLLVVHGISLPPNQFGGPYIEQLFTNCLQVKDHAWFTQIADLKVSAHLVIYRDGNIMQFVPFSKRAWHAGKSVFKQRENCGDFSIGIELEGADDIPYTETQYQLLSETITAIRVEYPAITLDNIVGHSDIAPGRKTDPGESFDWNKLHGLLHGKGEV